MRKRNEENMENNERENLTKGEEEESGGKEEGRA